MDTYGNVNHDAIIYGHLIYGSNQKRAFFYIYLWILFILNINIKRGCTNNLKFLYSFRYANQKAKLSKAKWVKKHFRCGLK